MSAAAAIGVVGIGYILIQWMLNYDNDKKGR